MDKLWCVFNKQYGSWSWQHSWTHPGRMTHICVNKLISIGSDNGLLPGQCQAIIWTNAGIFLIVPFGTNFREISIEIHIFSCKKMHLTMLSAKCWPSCLGLNVLTLCERIFFQENEYMHLHFITIPQHPNLQAAEIHSQASQKIPCYTSSISWVWWPGN